MRGRATLLLLLALAGPARAQDVIPNTNSTYFPRWGRDAYQLRLAPLFGYRVGNTKTIAGLATSSGLELGGRIDFLDLHLIKGNPGLGLSFGAGGAGARIRTQLSGAQGFAGKESTVIVKRGWAETGARVYLKAVRVLMNVSRGVLEYDREGVPLVQDVSTAEDVSLRVFRFMSVHASNRYRHVFDTELTEPTTAELDNWAHVRVSVPSIRLDADFGPGATYTQESYLNEVSAEGWAKHVTAKFWLSNYWDYDLESRVRYTYATTDDGLGRYATMRLSRDNFYTPNELTAPEDTLAMSFFVASHGTNPRLGWWTSVTTFDYQRRQGRKSQLTRETGLGVSFGYDM